jgi:hypothetical protein
MNETEEKRNVKIDTLRWREICNLCWIIKGMEKTMKNNECIWERCGCQWQHSPCSGHPLPTSPMNPHLTSG